LQPKVFDMPDEIKIRTKTLIGNRIAGLAEVVVPSTLDGVLEPSLLYYPPHGERVPLLVGLHTWSYDRFNQLDRLLPLCRQRGWALLLPEARGPSLIGNPRVRQAGGSVYAQQDVIDALIWVQDNYSVDEGRTFLLGGSGGGHLALLVAAREPSLWSAVSAWVPITDLAAWHDENSEYAGHVAASCGGTPGESPSLKERYQERSPLFLAHRLKDVRLFLHHGRFDPVVQARHSWQLALALEESGAQQFFFEIFDGGHEIRAEQAVNWFDRQPSQEESLNRLTG
jgi:dipeptidyl aminopeptidase/acylaminoacyl peptidase